MVPSLPDPDLDAGPAVTRAISERASRRSFASTPVEPADAALLLWAAQGVTHARDGIEMRAAPSAGATHPLVAYLEVPVDGGGTFDPGVYRYRPREHALEEHVTGDVRDALVRAAGGQPVVRDAPATLALTARFERTRREYPDHGDRYVHMEAGHAAENVLLACEAAGLGGCPVGAFSDAALADALALPGDQDPLYLVPFGHTVER